MKPLNLSEWALKHRQMMAFLIIVFMVSGVLSYLKLGRAEDPDFTFKLMVVRTLWTGASADEMQRQVTELIEKKLQDVPFVDVVRSHSRAGESLVFVSLKTSTPKAEVPNSWYQVRKKIGDIAFSFPEGVLGPFFNDEFGDTFIHILALTGDGFDLGQLKRTADNMARELRHVPNVKKIELIGVQEEQIFVDISHTRLATLGILPAQIIESLKKQNALHSAGFFETANDRVRLRVSGAFTSMKDIENVSVAANGKLMRLGDIAQIRRGFIDPPAPQMKVAGIPAVGIAISMAKGGDVITLGKELRKEIDRLQSELPTGIDVHIVADQPEVVDESISLFMSSLLEAVIIVLAVSFLSLGLRTGAVVALSIPLVLALTFLAMRVFDIDLQRVSLGALIIALGLLVDDAIIAVEMMVVKMEQGWDRMRAATFAYTSTAFPMLTGTLITVAAFTPVGFAKSDAGEYTFSIFAVVGLALVISWIVAVTFTPYIGYKLLNPKKFHQKHAANAHDDIYQSAFYQRIYQSVNWCLVHRWKVIFGTLILFIGSIIIFNTAIQKQFFPTSNRPELLLDVWLPRGASQKATEEETKKLDAILAAPEMAEEIKHVASYIGNGSPRFYLALDQQLLSNNYAQFIITARDLKARDALKTKLEKRFFNAEKDDFPNTRLRLILLENGPPVGYPVQFRVSGDDLTMLKNKAEEIAKIMRDNPYTHDVNLDWNELSKSVHLALDQDRARLLGVSTQELSDSLALLLNGIPTTQMREGTELINVVLRASDAERANLAGLENINIRTQTGRFVALSQLVKISYTQEDGLISRRNRKPTITIRADIRTDLPKVMQAPIVSSQIKEKLTPLIDKLPAGFSVEEGGSTEESQKGESSIMAVVPLMIALVITLLMIQLQNIGRTFLVLLTAPLGMIGVTLALLISGMPYGFVANLGVIALAGMIMRNSVILVDQIEQDEKAGKSPWEAIVSSTVRRFRPILLTAAAAILAMIPLARSIFWGPMAVAIMGGLLVATFLTIFFLPALYAAWYKVKKSR